MIVEEIVEFAQSHPAVFIVGMERGGTSILCRTLSTASCFSELTSKFETFVFDAPERVLSDSPRDMTVQYLGGTAQFAEFRDWFGGLSGWPDEWGRPRRIASAYLFFAHVVNGRHRIIEKTPRHVFALDFIIRCFPKARIVGAIRHPFGVIESYRGRLKREIELGRPRESYEWLDREPGQICMHLTKICDALYQAKGRYGEKIVITSYDEMLRDPELVFALLADFIGVSDLKFEVNDSDVAETASSADPLLESGKIQRGNTIKTSLTLAERVKLVQSFPALFAKAACLSI